MLKEFLQTERLKLLEKRKDRQCKCENLRFMLRETERLVTDQETKHKLVCYLSSRLEGETRCLQLVNERLYEVSVFLEMLVEGENLS